MRNRLIRVGLLVTALAVAVPQIAGAALISIAMRDDFFDPVSQNVVQGDQVQWPNVGANPHTATSDTPGLFDTGVVNPSQTSAPITITLPPGTYRYYCVLHGAPGGVGMSGILVVAAGGGTTTVPPTTTTVVPTTSTTTTVVPSTTTTTTVVPSTTTPTSSTIPSTTTPTSSTIPSTTTPTSSTIPSTTTPTSSTIPTSTSTTFPTSTTLLPTTTTTPPPSTIPPTTSTTVTSATSTTIRPPTTTTTSTPLPPASRVCSALLQARTQVRAAIDTLIARFPQLAPRLTAIRDQALASIDARLRQFGCTIPAGPAPSARLAWVDSPASALALARHVADEQVARAQQVAASARGQGRR